MPSLGEVAVLSNLAAEEDLLFLLAEGQRSNGDQGFGDLGIWRATGFASASERKGDSHQIWVR